MKIPSCFFGRKKDVRLECNKVARKILKGVPLLEAVAAYQMIDTNDVPEASLVVCYPYDIIDNAPRFYMTRIDDAIERSFWYKKSDRDKEDKLFDKFLENEWSILSFCDNPIWFKPDSGRHRWQPYLRKLCEFWDILHGEEERYFGSGTTLNTFWKANETMKYVLGFMGVSRDEALEPSDPANLRGLCDKYNLLTVDVFNDPDISARYPYCD